MSFKISDTEKKVAFDAMKNFSSTLNSLSIAKDHLDILYGPFKKAQTISSEVLIEYRGKLNRFRSKVEDNFSTTKDYAFEALNKLNYFSTDTHCGELISSFKEAMNDLMKSSQKLIEILDDYKTEDFKDKIIVAIDNIKKESAQLENLIKDRIINHIKKNIIGETWINDSNKVKNLTEKIPTVIDIYQKINNSKVTQDQNNLMPQNQKRPQILNVSDSQRVFYPQDLRESGKIAK